ncbi:hypothetical protein VTN77DRAFT_1088 [Rasamsonia byssochlamydoides]|uniref:uncharacterized protein n=1 Tax=Rasamsonia byssochlamydoides TaxID=89139 RepID=UPI003743B4FB
MRAVANNDPNVRYLYSRRLDFLWNTVPDGSGHDINQCILEVVYDITDAPYLQQRPTDIFAVFHFHVEEVMTNYVGVRSINVFHAQGVRYVEETNDYQVAGLRYDRVNGRPGRNQRAHILQCWDDGNNNIEDDWLARQFIPGFPLPGVTGTGSVQIYELGQTL